ncbi:TPA: hypothetical protein ACH3X3_011253 [Trebouxia sp. C0006]
MQLKPAPTPRPQPTPHPKPPTPNPHPIPPPQTPTPYSYPNPAPSPHPLQLAIQWLIIPFMNPPLTQFTKDKLEVFRARGVTRYKCYYRLDQLRPCNSEPLPPSNNHLADPQAPPHPRPQLS